MLHNNLGNAGDCFSIALLKDSPIDNSYTTDLNIFLYFLFLYCLPIIFKASTKGIPAFKYVDN